MTTYYLDTSVAVHALRGTPAAEAWFEDVTRHPDSGLVSSRLLQTELTRVLRRDGLPLAGREIILQQVGLIELTEAVLAAAEAMTGHVKTLDSIHLASALYAGSETVVVSHDENLKRLAAELGLSTYDPLEPAGDDG